MYFLCVFFYNLCKLSHFLLEKSDLLEKSETAINKTVTQGHRDNMRKIGTVQEKPGRLEYVFYLHFYFYFTFVFYVVNFLYMKYSVGSADDSIRKDEGKIDN